MKLSKLTILEMLEQIQIDRDEAIAEMDIQYLGKEIAEITKPIDLIVYWLNRELRSEAT